jgi:hypothetical protein
METFKSYFLSESSYISKYMAYKFSSLLAKKFVDWDAYELGIIDEKGNKIKEPQTKEERDALNNLNNLVRKIKKLLVKYTNDSRLVNFMIGAYLLKENEDFISEMNTILNENETYMLSNYLQELKESE